MSRIALRLLGPPEVKLDDETKGPVENIVNEILVNAVRMNASDIHIEPFETHIRLRIRIDGTLETVDKTIPNHPGFVRRIKIMSKMRAHDTLQPQDQRTRLKVDGRIIDFRVSTVPTDHGEKIVLRILDKQNLKIDLKELGFEDAPREALKVAIGKPYRMVLVSGPPGSGKTTTLY